MLWELEYETDLVISMRVRPNGNRFTSTTDGAHILSSSGDWLLQLSDRRVISSGVLPNGNLLVGVFRSASVFNCESDELERSCRKLSADGGVRTAQFILGHLELSSLSLPKVSGERS